MKRGTLHLYWGGGPLSFLRAQTVFTFAKHNPKWRIKIWRPTFPGINPKWKTGEQAEPYHGIDWMPVVLKQPYVQECAVDLPGDLPEVLRSDLLRWQLLSTEGGWWSDFDIVFVRPMTHMAKPYAGLGYFQYTVKEERICPIGFLGSMSEESRKVFALVHELASAHLAHGPTEYQKLGRYMLESVMANYVYPPLPTEIIYPNTSVRKSAIYFERSPYKLPSCTIGLHWYAGAREFRRWEQMLTPVKMERVHDGMNIVKAINGNLI